jgi:hypothetical protein
MGPYIFTHVFVKFKKEMPTLAIRIHSINLQLFPWQWV